MVISSLKKNHLTGFVPIVGNYTKNMSKPYFKLWIPKYLKEKITKLFPDTSKEILSDYGQGYYQALLNVLNTVDLYEYGMISTNAPPEKNLPETGVSDIP